ncbi:MAG TPA: cobalamin-independent methionine synthase II family protein [Tepidisphaeraceae bacterium]|jgi:5-methyltetrahydropteroyltriglutamate--homocysteine methyltransferase|nr:cobalamin-independent methionine synthase II family protein [Tepidisphaeraceae bacterium]
MPKNDYGVLFPTSVVGSLPRPAYVKDIISDDYQGSPADYRRHMEDAIRSAVAMQEMAGLDIITDGEWWRKSYIGVIAELAHGFELSRNPADGRPWTVVVDKLSPKTPGFIANEVKFLKTLTKRHIKATLPSPALLGERMWHPEKSKKAYPTVNDFVRDCVPILRHELELLRDEGATIVQIDDPHLCLFVDPDVRKKYDNADKAASFDVEMVNQLVDGMKGVKLALHLCRRAGARVRGEESHAGSYDPIIEHLNRLNVHHLTMEFTAPGAGDTAVLRKLRPDLEIGLGCVSCHPGQVDSADTIVQRVEMALKHIAAERLTLNPDCGFAPGSAANVDTDEVYTKLKHEVEAARRLREMHR